MSRVLLALLCSALLCSAVSIWRRFHPCQPLFTSFFKILGKAKPQLYRRKAAIPTREISRRFPADRLQLADPMGPCSFAPPACAGFADSIYRCVQYTILPQNCKRKATIFIANCSKFLQILHRAGNIPVLRHIQMNESRFSNYFIEKWDLSYPRSLAIWSFPLFHVKAPILQNAPNAKLIFLCMAAI